MPSLFKPDSTALTLVVAILVAIGISVGVHYLPNYLAGEQVARTSGAAPVASSPGAAQQTATGSSAQTASRTSGQWEASAAGRVEPKGGRINVRPETSGTIVRVIAGVNDKVKKGDILVLLDDAEVRAKLQAARAEVAVRLGERDEEPEKSALMIERRKADDAIAKAQRDLHDAQMAFDRVFLARHGGNATEADVEKARAAIEEAKRKIETEKENRIAVLSKKDMPTPTRLDSGLAIARSDLRIAEISLERTRVRSTAAGTVLSFNAVEGEVANVRATVPVAVVGDLSGLEVRAEVDERDVSKVFRDQSVVIRSNAYPGRDFTGKVTLVEPALGTPGLKARGPRKPSDVDVLEVKIDLEGDTPLLPGMRVDVFFKKKEPVKSAAKN